LEQAVGIWEKEKKNFNKAMSLNLLGLIYYKLHRDNDATDLLKEAIRIFDDLGEKSCKARAHYRLCSMSRANFNIDERLSRLERLVFINPKDINTRITYANLLSQNEQSTKAITVITEGLKTNEHNPVLIRSMVMLLLNLEKFEEVDGIINSLVYPELNNIENFLTLCQAMGRLLEAGRITTEQYKKIIDKKNNISPPGIPTKEQKARFWNELGNAAKMLYEFDEAHSCYTRAMVLGFRKSQIQNNFGLLYMKMAEASKIKENLLETNNLLQRAEEAFCQAVVSSEPGSLFVWPLISLADIYITKNDLKGAQSWLREIEDMLPEGFNNKEILKKLEFIRNCIEELSQSTP